MLSTCSEWLKLYLRCMAETVTRSQTHLSSGIACSKTFKACRCSNIQNKIQQKNWTKKFPFISAVHQDPYRYVTMLALLKTNLCSDYNYNYRWPLPRFNWYIHTACTTDFCVTFGPKLSHGKARTQIQSQNFTRSINTIFFESCNCWGKIKENWGGG